METKFILDVTDASTLSPPTPNEKTLTTATATDTRLTWQICALLITTTTTLVYLNSFQGVALFDDTLFIDQPFTHEFWSSLFAPDLLSRPLIGLSLYINYKISGTTLWSYHLFNLLVHLISALALFGIVRQICNLERFRAQYADKANLFALIISLVWAVHPLQTQSVTYIIQRCESVMGMFYLLTIYFSIKSIQAEQKTKWYAAAVIACACGMLSKQVMVTAPLMVILFDWMFLSDNFKETLSKRWKLYAGLATNWSLLVITSLASPVNKTAGFAVQTIAPLQYLKVEFAVIIHYLKLAFYPNALCLDYSWTKTTSFSEMLPNAIAVCLLLALTMYGVIRRKPLAFPIAWFFLILSLTSSIVPFDDPAFEHRMYLPLAGIVVVTVFGLYLFGIYCQKHYHLARQISSTVMRPLVLILVTAIVSLFGWLTIARNMDYHSALRMWLDVVQQRPQNARALNNVGKIYLDNGEYDKAIAYLSASCQYNPTNKKALYNLGTALLKKGDFDNARLLALEVVKIDPEFIEAYNLAGQAELSQNRIANAKEQFLAVLKVNENHASAHTNLARALMIEKNYREAESHFRKAAEIEPNSADARFNLGILLLSTGRVTEATNEFLESTQINSQNPQAFYNLGLALAEQNRFAEASQAYRNALNLAPDSPQALNQLAYILATSSDPNLRNPEEAVKLAQRAVGLLNARHPIPLNTLAKAYAEAGHFPEAIQTAQKAIEVAIQTGNSEVKASAETCLKLYQSGRTH